MTATGRVRRAFTLIELLVVISIIALLIAILLPVLSSARSSAQKIQCLANLQQLATSSANFSSDYQGETPPPTADHYLAAAQRPATYIVWKTGPWGDTTKFTTLDEKNDSRFGKYRKAGVLFDKDYSDVPEILYCPSMSKSHPWLAPGGIRPGGTFGGWFYDTNRPAGITRMETSYHYRDTYQGEAYSGNFSIVAKRQLMHKNLDFDRDLTDMVLFADAFTDKNRGKDFAHGDGYNFARLDGSGEYFLDPSDQIRGFANADTFAKSVEKMERVFESMRYGEIVGERNFDRP